jgi:hypothetical protein
MPSGIQHRSQTICCREYSAVWPERFELLLSAEHSVRDLLRRQISCAKSECRSADPMPCVVGFQPLHLLTYLVPVQILNALHNPAADVRYR